MTDLDPILYCNGKLRVTRHGDRGGGTSVVFVDPGDGFAYPQQFDVPDERTEGLLAALDAAQNAWNEPAYVFGYGWGWTLNRKSKT